MASLHAQTLRGRLHPHGDDPVGRRDRIGATGLFHRVPHDGPPGRSARRYCAACWSSSSGRCSAIGGYARSGGHECLPRRRAGRLAGETRPRLSSLARTESAVVLPAQQGGGHPIFNELVLRRQGRIRDLLRRLCGSADQADDLAQQAFLQAWRTLERCGRRRRLSGWPRRIAVHVWLQSVRGGRLKDDGDYEIASQTVADQGGIRLSAPASASTPSGPC